MQCTSLCAGESVIAGLPSNCGTQEPRDEKKAKLLFWRCDIAIPVGDDDAVALALSDLLAAGTIGVTGKLKNFQFSDPQSTDQSFTDCDVPEPIYTQRDLTFEDFNKFDTAPGGGIVPYYDRNFWAGVTLSGQKWNYGYTTCDGKLYLLTDRLGTFFDGKLTVFKSEDRGTANKIYEVKKGTIRFLGDPESGFNTPFIDLATQILTYPTLANLYQ